MASRSMILEKNSIFYRFASEPDVVEKLEFTGRHIAVGDIKQAIADLKKLNKLDLVLVNEATKEIYKKDGLLLQRNMSVTVRRTPPQTSRKRSSIVHVETTDVWDRMSLPKQVKTEEVQAPIQRRACPPEYLCPLCNDIYEDPMIARCCGKSACSRCIGGASAIDLTGVADADSPCPLCRAARSSTAAKPIPNNALADTVASLDLDYFVLPREVKAAAAARRAKAIAVVAETRGALPGLAPGTLMPTPPHLGVLPTSNLSHSSSTPVPAGGVVRPCMLTPEQFFAWQQSLREQDEYSYYSTESEASSERRRRKQRKKEKKGKKKAKRARVA